MKQLWTWTCLVLALVGCGGPVEEVGAPGEQPAMDSETQAEQSWASEHPGETRWAKRLTGPGDEGASGVAVDRDGDIIVVAGFSGSLADDRGTLATAPDGGFVVAKYHPNGTRVWARSFEGFASALAVDRDRHIFITGGLGPGSAPLTSRFFLRKLDCQGHPVGMREWLLEGPSFVGHRLAVDSEGHIALAGSLEGSLHFDRGSVTGAGEAVLVKFDRSGHFQWGVSGPQFSSGRALAVDEDDNLYLGGNQQTDLVGPKDFIPFVFRFSPSGTRVWEKFLDSKFGSVNGLVVHGDRVVAVGAFSQPLTFHGQTYTPRPGGEGFIVALTRGKEERWARAFGVTALDVAADDHDDILVVGRYEKGDDAGLGPLPGVAGSDFNLFVAKYDRVTGTPRWTRGFPQAHPSDIDVSGAAYSIAADRNGSSTVFGSLVAPVDFGPTRLSPAPGSRDLFLLELKR